MCRDCGYDGLMGNVAVDYLGQLETDSAVFRVMFTCLCHRLQGLRLSDLRGQAYGSNHLESMFPVRPWLILQSVRFRNSVLRI